MKTTEGNKIMQQIDYSSNAMLMLNASCQGIVEVYIEPADNKWYPILENELVTAQRLVREWRNSGALFFNEYILGSAIECGQNFIDQKETINGYFDTLIARPDDAVKEKLINALTSLKSPIDTIDKKINAYEIQLRDWGVRMQKACSDMNLSVKQIQAEAADLKAQIDSINATIKSLQDQIKTDRDAIAKAQAEEDRGKYETIFGIIFAPFTAGLSLILAGIGVASIAEAESEISAMQASISDYQGKITKDQHTMDDDQKEIAALGGLTMSLGTCIDDMNVIATSLDQLKDMWQLYANTLADEINKLNKAENAQAYIVGKAAFNAACSEWKDVVPSTQSIIDSPLISNHIQI